MRKRLTLVTAVLALAFALVSAQDETTAVVQVAESAMWGEHLVDAEGNSLYVYTNDEQGAGTSVCVDACVNNWPPVTVDGEPVVGEGVDSELVGTIDREDGTVQFTYNGWPLYTYARDANPGDTRGAGLGNSFFLIGLDGELIKEQVEQEAAEIDPELMDELMTTGQQAYAANCQVCHGNEGQGGIGPRLSDNRLLGDNQFLIERIIHGYPEHGMPPFAHLSDQQIAAISTFVRNSWGNEFGPITAEEVSEYRP